MVKIVLFYHQFNAHFGYVDLHYIMCLLLKPLVIFFMCLCQSLLTIRLSECYRSQAGSVPDLKPIVASIHYVNLPVYDLCCNSKFLKLYFVLNQLIRLPFSML